ncbi:Vacuolar protein 8 [Phlyctochytrium bullatum]|nr:Vacuolar protein 8 [Phlyctochytrium bullatum]
MNRTRLATSEPTIIPSLIRLTDSPSLKVQCQAALALRNLASDDKFQLDIVAHNGLDSLLRLLKSKAPQIVLAAAACIRNISIHPANEAPIVKAGFLAPLVELLPYDNEEIQCHAMSTIRNLASSDENKIAIVNAGAVEKIGGLLRMSVVPLSVKAEMTACLAVLALTGMATSKCSFSLTTAAIADEVKPAVLKLLRPLVKHTSSPSVDVRANSAAAIGNLASKQRLRSKVVQDSEILTVCRQITSSAPPPEASGEGEQEGEGVLWLCQALLQELDAPRG